MSSTRRIAATSSNFEALFDAALVEYAERTGNDLRDHPLASTIEQCDSIDSILALFQKQARAVDGFRNDDPRLIKWLRPVLSGVHILSTSPALSNGAGFVFPPAKHIFSAISILLSTANAVRESYDALVVIFECLDNFLGRLMIYTKIEQPAPVMTDVLVKILAELISVLALATKQISQGRFRKYAKKLLGEKAIESVLQRLDRLTTEESKATAAQTLDVVYGLVNNMKTVMEDGKGSIVDIRQTLVLMQEMAMKLNKMERDHLRERFRRWVSAPDPWENHNTARKAHHRGTATWFTQGKIMKEWISTGSLLWVNGLPGSGKTILCSTVIENVQETCQTGLATCALFYFDFRDTRKQDARSLLSSILIQLSHQSHKFSELFSSLYSTHDNGSRQPSVDALLECLKNMLRLPGQGELYVIIDALDECSNSSGLTSPRAEVLKIVQKLVALRLRHVHFCITSRPEIDIQNVLGILANHSVSLHDEGGQNQDIITYIESVVLTHPNMQRWREEDKRLVIDTLIARAGGMFRWVHCQLETLSRCFPPSIRRALDELPKTLDETYEQTLLEIDEEKQAYAHRLFQCLVISIRPLHVEELAEIFAVLPNAASITGFRSGWRPENPEEFILSACSTLVAVVNVKSKKLVQFSHFSVREYLTSNRIANSERASRRFHVLPKPAHTLFARACLSVLLQLDNSIDSVKIKGFPLALYAAEHWVDHARFDGVSLDIQDGMDYLFDTDKPHFSAWIWLYDIANPGKRARRARHPTQPDGVPLYYAALCGFRDLAERLLSDSPLDVMARGGYQGTPLHAAADKGHLDIVLLLLERGASVESWGRLGQTPVYMASSRGYVEVVRSLIDRRANLNVECDDFDKDGKSMKGTPLLMASKHGKLETARVLLEHGADLYYSDKHGRSPLHLASQQSCNDIVRLLLDHGANPNISGVTGYTGDTLLHEAISYGRISIVMSLLEYGANVYARNLLGDSPLHTAARLGYLDAVRLLLDRGADVNGRNHFLSTALHKAASNGHLDVVELLLEHGADPQAQNEKGETPFQWASMGGRLQVMRLLSERISERVHSYTVVIL